MISIFLGFKRHFFKHSGADIYYRIGGKGDPILLLHGFPQTHAMWAEIAPRLARYFTVICADLRGYGASEKPHGTENYSFRAMGSDQLALMSHLGFEEFHLVGHDRGARVSHRVALDASDRIKSLTMMDIVPTHLLLNKLSKEVARDYYHWLFLAQPEPFPETLIAANPNYYYEQSLLGWGSAKLSDFADEQLAAYRFSWNNPQTIRAMCDDYRAAIDFDFAIDEADLSRRVAAPTLVMWGTDGAMAKSYDMGMVWTEKLVDMHTCAIPGGHFFPDTSGTRTSDELLRFLRSI